jgi:hypothetical protein
MEERRCLLSYQERTRSRSEQNFGILQVGMRLYF